MNRQFVVMTLILLMAGSVVLRGQTSMAGRTYHNANVLADMMDEAVKDIDKKAAETKAEGKAEFEKKKGRKMTAEEEAKLDAEIQKLTKQAYALKKGMKMAVTVEFKDGKNLVMKQDTRLSDEVMKAAGMGWLKRKAMKAALAIAPKSSNGTYIVMNDMIIVMDKDKDKDTMYVSQDGKYLTANIDKNFKFKLTRTK